MMMFDSRRSSSTLTKEGEEKEKMAKEQPLFLKQKRRYPECHRMMKKYKVKIPQYILKLEITKSEYPTSDIVRDPNVIRDLYHLIQIQMVFQNQENSSSTSSSSSSSSSSFVKWMHPWFEEHSGLYFYGFLASSSFSPSSAKSSKISDFLVVDESHQQVQKIFDSIVQSDPIIKHNFSISLAIQTVEFDFQPTPGKYLSIGKLNEHLTKEDEEEENEDSEDDDEDNVIDSRQIPKKKET